MTANKIRDYLIVLILLLLIGVGGYEYYLHKAVPVQQVSSISADEITKALLKMGYKPTAQEVTTIIREVEKVKQSPPEAVKQTTTAKEGSLWAQQQAKQTGGDKLLWETPKPFTNNFYSLHLDKPHRVSLGMTAIDNKIYESLGYQDKWNEVIIHTQGLTPKGGTYMRTILRW